MTIHPSNINSHSNANALDTAPDPNNFQNPNELTPVQTEIDDHIYNATLLNLQSKIILMGGVGMEAYLISIPSPNHASVKNAIMAGIGLMTVLLSGVCAFEGRFERNRARNLSEVYYAIPGSRSTEPVQVTN